MLFRSSQSGQGRPSSPISTTSELYRKLLASINADPPYTAISRLSSFSRATSATRSNAARRAVLSKDACAGTYALRVVLADRTHHTRGRLRDFVIRYGLALAGLALAGASDRIRLRRGRVLLFALPDRDHAVECLDRALRGRGHAIATVQPHRAHFVPDGQFQTDIDGIGTFVVAQGGQVGADVCIAERIGLFLNASQTRGELHPHVLAASVGPLHMSHGSGRRRE